MAPSKIVSGDPDFRPRWPQSNLGTFWLKIEQFWPFEEISILSNGGHLGYRMRLTDSILKGDHPGSFQQSLVEIGSVVSEESIFFKKGGMKLKKILFSETTEPISTKLC
jgi:hypothetical protein